MAKQDSDFGARVDGVRRHLQHRFWGQGPGGHIHDAAVLRDMLRRARGIL
jgi:hypothetical protein